jgi:hypothetical protein
MGIPGYIYSVKGEPLTVLHTTEYLGITYDVFRYISTGRLPFEELIDTSHYQDWEENGDCF